MYIIPKNATKNSLYAWLICIAGALFFFIDFVQIGIPNTIRTPFINEFNIDSNTFSRMSFCFLIGNLTCILPAGAALRRFSTRQVLITAMAFSVLGSFGTAISTLFWLTCLFRFLSGVAHAFCFLCAAKLVRNWFTPDKNASVMGLVVGIGLAGLVVGQKPVRYLLTLYGWRFALLINAFVGLAAFIFAFVTIQDHPANQEKTLQIGNTTAEWKIAWKNQSTWLYALYVAFLNAPLPVICFGYLNKFLIESYGINEDEASNISTLFFTGNLIGSLMAGFIAEQWQSHKKPMLTGALIAFGSLSLLLFGPILSPTIASIVCFTFGFFVGYQVLAYPAIAMTSPPKLTGLAMTMTSFIVMGSMPLFDRITNLLFSYVGHDNPIYTRTDYLWGFSLLIASLLGAIIIALSIKETYKPPKK